MSVFPSFTERERLAWDEPQIIDFHGDTWGEGVDSLPAGGRTTCVRNDSKEKGRLHTVLTMACQTERVGHTALRQQLLEEAADLAAETLDLEGVDVLWDRAEHGDRADVCEILGVDAFAVAALLPVDLRRLVLDHWEAAIPSRRAAVLAALGVA